VIETTREFVRGVYDVLLGDSDLSWRVAMATHELLENLDKYASAGFREFEIGLVERNGQRFVRIRTTNRSTPERLAVLRSVLNEVGGSSDPFRTYIEYMVRSSKSRSKSGLGLARIRAEARMEIRHVISGNQVTITAESPAESGMDP
jgi:hypothetical protein